MPDDHQADQLGAYADRWLDGQINEPTTAEEATFARLQRVLGATSSTSSIHPIAHQENPMLPTASIQPLPMPTPIRHRSPAMATLERWQPAISFTIMLVLIGGLLAIAWDRQVRNADPDPTANAILLDDATPATEGCDPPPPSAADDELVSASLSDWDTPAYFARDYADEQTARKARAAFMSYLNCADAVGYFLEDGQTFTPAIRDYFSPRTRYMTLYDDLTGEQQAAIDTFACRPKEAEVLRDFPILVNNQLLPVPMSSDNPHTMYDAYDVFLLGDGRYGMALGRITTETLRNPADVVARDQLGILTLVEQDGHFYIDEFFIVVSSDPSLYSYGQMTGDCD